MSWLAGWPRAGRIAALVAIGSAGLLVLGLAMAGAGLVGGGSLLFASGTGCTGGGSQGGTAVTVAQPAASTAGRNSIPANFLRLYKQTGAKYGVPWVMLAGIGKVESDHGRTSLPGVRNGANAFGAAGPMQIGIGGAAGDAWGGAPVHPAGLRVAGVATDANSDGTASVYDPADAIAGSAKYLLAHGVLSDPAGAVFAYNHLASYVQAVLSWAGLYAQGGFTVSAVTTAVQAQCATTAGDQVPNQAVASVIAFSRQQLGKPYLWGGTGPDAFDCSGLMMMAYRAVGVNIPRTSQLQWTWGPRIAAGHEQPGDLVFFAGADGTRASPGHVGLVIGHGLMIEAYSTGFPIRIAPYGNRDAVGFTRPWAHPGTVLAGAQPGNQHGA